MQTPKPGAASTTPTTRRTPRPPLDPVQPCERGGRPGKADRTSICRDFWNALPRPGQVWPGQQSLYASVVHATTGAAWALLLPTDLPKLPDQVWGEYGKRIEGADSVIDGYANTLAMAAAGNKLAQAVRALPGDCYLPGPLEALMLFAALREQVGPGVLWTSRQYSAGYAWVQYFDNGLQDVGGKDNEWRAVPVRRSMLRSFGTSIEVV